ncbi:hypothetical protein Hanom_Chr06g00492551 [Helianthus anomalus]
MAPTKPPANTLTVVKDLRVRLINSSTNQIFFSFLISISVFHYTSTPNYRVFNYCSNFYLTVT